MNGGESQETPAPDPAPAAPSAPSIPQSEGVFIQTPNIPQADALIKTWLPTPDGG